MLEKEFGWRNLFRIFNGFLLGNNYVVYVVITIRDFMEKLLS